MALNSAFLDGVLQKDAIDKAISDMELNSVLTEMGITKEAQDSEVAKAADAEGTSGTTGNYSDAEKTLTASADNKLMGSSPSTQSGGGGYMAGAIVISAGLAADDVSGVGVIGDLAIPLLISGAYALDEVTRLLC